MSKSETGQVTRETVRCNQFFSETFSCELSIKATRTDRIIKLVRADRNDPETSELECEPKSQKHRQRQMAGKASYHELLMVNKHLL